MTVLLTVTGLEAFYGRTQVLHGIDFQLKAGSITTILGANGAGKTTTLRALSAMVERRGHIRFADTDIHNLSCEAITRQKIAHVPEGRGTFLECTTEENLQLGAITRKDHQEIAQDMERMFGYFPRLKERRNQQAGTLSGGEQQMLAIARALMLRPRLLLLDEPSFGLAPLIVKEVFEILAKVNQEDDVSILLVEQNAGLALDLADKAYLLETGKIVRAGSSQEIRDDEQVRRSYLGY